MPPIPPPGIGGVSFFGCSVIVASLPPSSLSGFERLDCRRLTIDRNEPVKGRPADPELRCDLLDIAHLESFAIGPTKELADRFLSSARLKPHRAIGPRRVVAVIADVRHILIFDVHFSAAAVANVGESNSQIKRTRFGDFLNLDVYYQIRGVR
jgi:hypothetical protein